MTARHDIPGPGGSVPRLPVLHADDEVVASAELIDRFVELGYRRDTAAAMVEDYLRAASAAVGLPVHHWGMDGHDLDAILADRHAASGSARADKAGWGP